MSEKIVIAIPKGRILKELAPCFQKTGIVPEPAFYDEDSRQLSFATNRDDVMLIRVRSFDVVTYVAFGAAHLGVAGNDILLEFDYPEVYSPLDLGLGKCRMSLAAPAEIAHDPAFWRRSHTRVATKYVNVTKKFFASRGVQAECVKLSGAIELAPQLHLADRIVDLVSTGSTLKANGLVEVETIAEISTRLIVNRSSFKTRSAKISDLMDGFAEAVNG